MRQSKVWMTVCGVVLMQLVGCGAIRAASARQDYINHKTEEYVYSKPVDDVWGAARQMLFEMGYTVSDTGGGSSFTAETEWKVQGKERARYLLTAIRVDDEHCRVQFMRAEESLYDGNWNPDGTARDFEIEFELIKRVEPDTAQQIEAEAEVEGEKARG